MVAIIIPDCGFGGTLDLAIRVNWSNCANRGVTGENLTKDFGPHVLLPLLKRICDDILDHWNLDYIYNWVLLILCVVVIGGTCVWRCVAIR